MVGDSGAAGRIHPDSAIPDKLGVLGHDIAARVNDIATRLNEIAAGLARLPPDISVDEIDGELFVDFDSGIERASD